jgi:small membrane protein
LTQPIIKLLLLAAIALVSLYAVRGSRRAIHRVVWRASVVIGLVAAALSIAFPDILTRVAKLVGVGRGADLLLYLLVVAFMLVTVILFRRLSDLERKYVVLARTLAIRDAQASHPSVPRREDDE